MSFLLTVVFNIYAMWCNIFNFFERLIYPEQGFEKYSGVRTPCNSFYDFHKNIKYREDSWYMLWDVISIPEAIFARGGDDCDGFARLAYCHFGDEFKYQGVSFVFLGLCAFVFNSFPHHMEAVYIGSDGSYMVVGEQVRFFTRFELMAFYFNDFFKSNHKLKYLGVFKIVDNRISFDSVVKI